MTDFTLPIPTDPIYWIAKLPRPSWDSFFMMKVFVNCMKSPDQQTKQGAVIVDWDSKQELANGFNGHPRGVDGLPTFREGSCIVDEMRGTDGVLYRMGHPVPKHVDPVLRAEHALTAGLVMNDLEVVETDDAAHTLEQIFRVSPSYRVKNHREAFIQGNPDKYSSMAHCETNALISANNKSDNAVLYLPMPSCDGCSLLLSNSPHIKVKRVLYYEHRDFDQSIYAKKGICVEQYDADKFGHPDEWLIRTAQYARIRRLHSESISSSSRLKYTG